MNKSELIRELVKAQKISYKGDAKAVIDVIFGAMLDALLKGEKIEIRGFASLRLKKRLARIARNPKNGKKVFVPDRAVVYFKPSTLLLRSLNEKSR